MNEACQSCSSSSSSSSIDWATSQLGHKPVPSNAHEEGWQDLSTYDPGSGNGRKSVKRAITSTIGAGRSLLRGPGRLVALKTSTMPPMIRTYGLKARARAPSIAMLVTAGLAVMSAAATSGGGDSCLIDCLLSSSLPLLHALQ